MATKKKKVTKKRTASKKLITFNRVMDFLEVVSPIIVALIYVRSGWGQR